MSVLQHGVYGIVGAEQLYGTTIVAALHVTLPCRCESDKFAEFQLECQAIGEYFIM